MEDFSKAFLRLRKGVWLCKDTATIEASDGRRVHVTPGVTYERGKLVDGVDVSAWLDAYYEGHNLPAGGWQSVSSDDGPQSMGAILQRVKCSKCGRLLIEFERGSSTDEVKMHAQMDVGLRSDKLAQNKAIAKCQKCGGETEFDARYLGPKPSATPT